MAMHDMTILTLYDSSEVYDWKTPGREKRRNGSAVLAWPVSLLAMRSLIPSSNVQPVTCL